MGHPHFTDQGPWHLGVTGNCQRRQETEREIIFPSPTHTVYLPRDTGRAGLSDTKSVKIIPETGLALSYLSQDECRRWSSSPEPELSSSKALLARILLDIKYVEQLCTHITQLTEGWDKYSTETEVKQATDLQEQVFTLQALILADIGEILTRRQKINVGLMQHGEDDTEITEFVERSMDAPNGKVKGL